MSKVSVAATQMRCSWDIDDNVHRAEIKSFRESWGLFRDRRPDQYAALATFDGKVSG